MEIYFRNPSINGLQGDIAEKNKFVKEYIEYANENDDGLQFKI